MKRYENYFEMQRMAEAYAQIGAKPWNQLFWRADAMPKPPKPQLVKKVDTRPWLWCLEISVRTYNAILNNYRNSIREKHGSLPLYDSFPDETFVLSLHAQLIQNFGIVSFMDLVKALVTARTDALNIARSSLWQTAPPKWRTAAVSRTRAVRGPCQEVDELERLS